MELPNNPTWYDYKMLCVAGLMKLDMYLRSDKKGIHIYDEDGAGIKHLISYKKMKWEKFYSEILPKLVKE